LFTNIKWIDSRLNEYVKKCGAVDIYTPPKLLIWWSIYYIPHYIVLLYSEIFIVSAVVATSIPKVWQRVRSYWNCLRCEFLGTLRSNKYSKQVYGYFVHTYYSEFRPQTYTYRYRYYANIAVQIYFQKPFIDNKSPSRPQSRKMWANDWFDVKFQRRHYNNIVVSVLRVRITCAKFTLGRSS